MLSHKNRFTVTFLFFFTLFLLSIFFLFFFFTRTTLQPSLSNHTDLYLQLQLQPSPLPSPSPPPPPQQPSSSSSIATQPQPATATATDVNDATDHESVTDTDTVDNDNAALKECDLYTGTWVEDGNYPIYQPGSCPYVDEAYDCQINGRTDTHYTKWRWKPHACDLPRFSARDFLVRLKGKRLMLVGDSMNRNQFESILCILREGLQNKSKMYEIHGHKITKGRGYFVFKFEDYNCTVEFVRSHFLVKEGVRTNGQGSSNPTLSIDRIDKTSGRWKRADILVFNTGHWWTHGKTARGINYYKEDTNQSVTFFAVPLSVYFTPSHHTPPNSSFNLFPFSKCNEPILLHSQIPGASSSSGVPVKNKKTMPSSSPKSFFYARPAPSPFSSRRSFFLILTCLFLGLSCFFFVITGFLSPVRDHPCLNRNPRSVRVLWDHGTATGRNDGVPDRHKVMAFVGIQTGFGSVGRRQSLRKTWFPSDPNGLQRLEEATGLAFRFVIGRTGDRSKMSALKREIAEYDDFIQLDIEEEYSKLPYKTLAFFKAAYALYDADFYVKADDDIYLRPDRLSLLLAKERSHSQTYIGCMKKGPVFTDPKLKWYEPLSNLLGKEYFLHAYGPIYALSADVVSSLVALRNNSFRMFSNEDVTIGAWMLAMNVNHENNHKLCAPECTSTSIAVWDIPKCSGLCNPEKRMLELHQMDSCTQSPTVESDE